MIEVDKYIPGTLSTQMKVISLPEQGEGTIQYDTMKNPIVD